MTIFSNYPYYNRNQFSAYLFGAQSLLYPRGHIIIGQQVREECKKWVYIRHNQVIISPFCIIQYGLKYINPEELSINLDLLKLDFYTIIAVHNFQVEDCNPNLDECLAGVFFACHNAGVQEEPEEYPVECRAIKVLGHIDTIKRYVYDYQ